MNHYRDTKPISYGFIDPGCDCATEADVLALVAEATELLHNATYADGQGTVLTVDCECLEKALLPFNRED